LLTPSRTSRFILLSRSYRLFFQEWQTWREHDRLKIEGKTQSVSTLETLHPR
jgi:hypothetical protein